MARFIPFFVHVVPPPLARPIPSLPWSFMPRFHSPFSCHSLQPSCKLQLDSIVASVRPRRLIYFALDGAAPLAKMNQQRRFEQDASIPTPFLYSLRFTPHSRRYRSAAESSSSSSSSGFDRNAITPGTEFMQWLSHSVRLASLHRSPLPHHVARA